MAIPSWLLRKIYRKGSLHNHGGSFSLTLQNVLGPATLVAPPRFVINGVQFQPDQLESAVDVAAISAANPHSFNKGDVVEVTFPGHLLRGANRIHIVVATDEFGDLEIFVEERATSSDEEE
jgi:hypothetical protein